MCEEYKVNKGTKILKNVWVEEEWNQEKLKEKYSGCRTDKGDKRPDNQERDQVMNIKVDTNSVDNNYEEIWGEYMTYFDKANTCIEKCPEDSVKKMCEVTCGESIEVIPKWKIKLVSEVSIAKKRRKTNGSNKTGKIVDDDKNISGICESHKQESKSLPKGMGYIAKDKVKFIRPKGRYQLEPGIMRCQEIKIPRKNGFTEGQLVLIKPLREDGEIEMPPVEIVEQTSIIANTVKIWMLNTSKEKITLHHGHILGTVRRITEEEIIPISSEIINEAYKRTLKKAILENDKMEYMAKSQEEGKSIDKDIQDTDALSITTDQEYFGLFGRIEALMASG